jgi:hypothetical protein
VPERSIENFRDSIMDKVIPFTEREEGKAFPILLRHSQGTVLPNRTYVLGRLAVDAFRDAGVSFQELNGTDVSPTAQGVGAGERI